ncbi:phage portal protein [Schlesneria sp. T3-172]|uniref:phage portal protein n=1 Tax=Schlesneria sphaerica TaxID=3373610 RepID=UPI0037CC8567
MGWFTNLLNRVSGPLWAEPNSSAVASTAVAHTPKPSKDDKLASDDGFRRALGGAGNSGGWSSDHREEANHNTGFNYIAVHAIATQVAGATVTAFYDGDDRESKQARRKALATHCKGSFSRWKSIYGQDDTETDPLPSSHPLMKLLKRPNPHESGAAFRYRQAQQLRLTGRCLIWNVPSQAGQTCERYVIPTSMATWVNPTRDMPRGGWRVSMNGSRYVPLDDNGFIEGMPGIYMLLGATVDARQVQDIKYPHAWWLGDGWSPVMAGATFIDGANDIAVARSAHLRNGVTPAIVVSRKAEAGAVDKDELDRAQLAFNKKYSGPYNHAKVLWAPDGTDVTVVGADAKDMAYETGHKDFRESVFALHQVSPVAAGIQEVGTGSAYFTSMKQTRHAAIQPLCDMLAESDTEFLAPQFGEGITVEYEAAALDDDETENKEFDSMVSSQSFTRNEIRAKKGYTPLEGEDGEEIVGKPPAADPAGGMMGGMGGGLDGGDDGSGFQLGDGPSLGLFDDDEGGDEDGDEEEQEGDEDGGSPFGGPASADGDEDDEDPDGDERNDEDIPAANPGKLNKQPAPKPSKKPSQALFARRTPFSNKSSSYLAALRAVEEVDRAWLRNCVKGLTQEIDRAAKRVEAPLSDQQREAGNYRKGHVTIQGLRVSIETPKGGTRSGTDKAGNEWSVKMGCHYGYIKGTESAADGDHIDVFIGPHPESEIVFVIDQVNEDGEFDEHKCMIGYESTAEARDAYFSCYSKGWSGLGSITPMTMGQFKQWIEVGDTRKPVSEQIGQREKSYRKSFEESQHPRDDDGKFASGGSSNSLSGISPTASTAHLEKAIASGITVRAPQRTDLSDMDITAERPDGFIKTKLKLSDGTRLNCTLHFELVDGKVQLESVDSDAIGHSRELQGVNEDAFNSELEKHSEKLLTSDVITSIRSGLEREIRLRQRAVKLGLSDEEKPSAAVMAFLGIDSSASKREAEAVNG